MDLTDEIKFTENIDIALISSQLYDAITFSLPVPLSLDILLSLEFKALMHVASDFSLSLSLPKNALLPLKSKALMLVAKVIFF